MPLMKNSARHQSLKMVNQRSIIGRYMVQTMCWYMFFQWLQIYRYIFFHLPLKYPSVQVNVTLSIFIEAQGLWRTVQQAPIPAKNLVKNLASPCGPITKQCTVLDKSMLSKRAGWSRHQGPWDPKHLLTPKVNPQVALPTVFCVGYLGARSCILGYSHW